MNEHKGHLLKWARGCVPALALLSAGILLCHAAATIPAHAAAEDNIGWVTSVEGRSGVLHPGAGDFVEVKEGDEVFLGDEIKTGKNSTVTIELDDDSALTLSSETRLKITGWVYSKEEKKNSSAFKLFSGMARGILNGLFGASSEMTFETPTSLVGVKGSDITVWMEDGDTFAAVTEGAGFVRHLDPRFKEVVELRAGLMARIKTGEPVGMPAFIPELIKDRIKGLKIERRREFMEKLRKKKRLLRIDIRKKKGMGGKKRMDEIFKNR